MKIILAGIVCLFFGLCVSAQTENTEETDTATAEVEQISLLRDDGAGKAGDETENFSTADKILHFRIQLSSRKPAVVKMTLAANVAGVKPETKFITITYRTNGRQSIVNFTASPEDEWRAGKYRADIFIDGSPAGKKEFEIQNSKKSSETATPAPTTEPIVVPPPARRKKKT